jgi:uncharacterized protein YodC (DUF2158 family)
MKKIILAIILAGTMTSAFAVDIKVGDVVELKSGSIKMVVETIKSEKSDKIVCIWIGEQLSSTGVRSQELHRENFYSQDVFTLIKPQLESK